MGRSVTGGFIMAKLTAPLMSLGATGTIGKSLTFSSWKGINTARQRVSPSNPNTTAQAAQRSLFADAVQFWRSFLIELQGKEGWNRDASNSGKPQSGFNAFCSSATKIGAEDSEASLVGGIDNTLADTLSFFMKNLDDGATGDETGDFTLTVGTEITQMLSSYTASIVAGTLPFDVSADFSAGDVIYCQVTKTAGSIDGAKRSGIMKITLTS